MAARRVQPFGYLVFFGVSADFWLSLQIGWDLYKANQQEEQELEEIQDYQHLHRPAV